MDNSENLFPPQPQGLFPKTRRSFVTSFNTEEEDTINLQCGQVFCADSLESIEQSQFRNQIIDFNDKDSDNIHQNCGIFSQNKIENSFPSEVIPLSTIIANTILTVKNMKNKEMLLSDFVQSEEYQQTLKNLLKIKKRVKLYLISRKEDREKGELQAREKLQAKAKEDLKLSPAKIENITTSLSDKINPNLKPQKISTSLNDHAIERIAEKISIPNQQPLTITDIRNVIHEALKEHTISNTYPSTYVEDTLKVITNSFKELTRVVSSTIIEELKDILELIPNTNYFNAFHDTLMNNISKNVIQNTQQCLNILQENIIHSFSTRPGQSHLQQMTRQSPSNPVISAEKHANSNTTAEHLSSKHNQQIPSSQTSTSSSGIPVAEELTPILISPKSRELFEKLETFITSIKFQDQPNIKSIQLKNNLFKIFCGSKNSREQLLTLLNANKELTSLAIVEAEVSQRSRVILFNVPELQHEDLLASLKLIFHCNERDIEFLAEQPGTRKNRSHVILDLPPLLANNLIKNRFVFLGLNKIYIKLFRLPRRCLQCQSLRHTEQTCKNDIFCVVCAGEHSGENCINQYRCFNCLENNKKKNTKFNTEHMADDVSCPSVALILKEFRSFNKDQNGEPQTQQRINITTTKPPPRTSRRITRQLKFLRSPPPPSSIETNSQPNKMRAKNSKVSLYAL